MGYYTRYKITFLSNNTLQDDESLIKDLEELSGESFEKEDEHSYSPGEEIKWYSYDQDIVRFSTEHPEVVIQVDGDGEGNCDIWRDYLKGGKRRIYMPVLEFPDYSEDDLE